MQPFRGGGVEGPCHGLIRYCVVGFYLFVLYGVCFCFCFLCLFGVFVYLCIVVVIVVLQICNVTRKLRHKAVY